MASAGPASYKCMASAGLATNTGNRFGKLTGDRRAGRRNHIIIGRFQKVLLRESYGYKFVSYYKSCM